MPSLFLLYSVSLPHALLSYIQTFYNQVLLYVLYLKPVNKMCVGIAFIEASPILESVSRQPLTPPLRHYLPTCTFICETVQGHRPGYGEVGTYIKVMRN